MMNQQHRGVSGERRVLEGKVVVVAVKASKDVPRTALLWALAYVVQPGDCVKVLVLVPAHNSGRKLWGLLKFTSDCTTTHRRSLSGLSSEVKDDIMASCSKLMHQLNDVYDSKRIKVKIKILADSPYGMVAVESRRAQAKWVVLDRKLKHEEKICMEGLQCNVVAMKHSRPMVLRLNLVEPSKILEPQTEMQDLFDMDPGPYVTPASSPEQGTPFTATDAGSSSISSSDPGASPFYLCRIKRDLGGKELLITEENQNVDKFNSDTDNDKANSSSPLTSFWPWIVDTIGSWGKHSRHVMDEPLSPFYRDMASPFKALQGKNSKFHQEFEIEAMNYGLDLHLGRSMREVISLPRNAPVSPPLCSKCQHQAPEFGKPPRSFSYSELDIATGGFSRNNFLAEGGFGSVHRGVLPDGQVIAVKQHKLASSQGDLEFCSEVEVLSCAQHRNVVTLIGFCVEENRRLLVYEYICNGSVACHLYGHNRDPLEWWARQNIAVGAARGLRYLHEECRVGCIVHRDLRPNNILITHDFEPLVGDFGLARWQPDGETGVTTRVIGTLGYLAPEYAQSGQITEKADVYSFGVVLVELITGRKAMDISRPKGQQCLTEWARPLLEQYDITKLVDPRLINYSKQEIYNMFHCASLCIRRDPHSRPCMSQVLRMLEGDIVVNTANHTLNSGCNFGNSGRRMRIKTQHPCHQQHDGGSILKETAKVSSRRVSNKTGKSTLLGEYFMGRRSRHGVPLIPTQR